MTARLVEVAIRLTAIILALWFLMTFAPSLLMVALWFLTGGPYGDY